MQEKDVQIVSTNVLTSFCVPIEMYEAWAFRAFAFGLLHVLWEKGSSLPLSWNVHHGPCPYLQFALCATSYHVAMNFVAKLSTSLVRRCQ